MIIEFAVGDDANLLEHELTRGTCEHVVTVWTAPGVFRLVGDLRHLQPIMEQRWARLPVDLPPAKLIRTE